MMLIMLYDTDARIQELADLKRSKLHLDVPNPFVTLSCEAPKSVHCHMIRKTRAMDLYKNNLHSHLL